MDLVPENSKDYITKESYLPDVHSAIEFISKSIDVILENSEDYIRNESYL